MMKHGQTSVRSWVQKGLKDRRDLRVFKVKRDHRDLRVFKVKRDHRDFRVFKVFKVKRDRRDLRVFKVKQASVFLPVGLVEDFFRKQPQPITIPSGQSSALPIL